MSDYQSETNEWLETIIDIAGILTLFVGFVWLVVKLAGH